MKQATEGINGPFENNKIKIEGGWFKDIISHRTVGFRGINLGGNSKLPVNWTTSNGIDAYDIDNLSFIGKPLPLAEAEEHCLRLRYWGFNFLRLLVPWESIEHQGPGKYDENQMNYIIKLLFVFKKFGLKCLIDPHQDTWSRLCGGSGMPNWTLYLAGLDPRKFKQTISAVTMFEHDPPLEYPIMTWPTNYGRLATATMFTLFFAGEKLAPKCTIYDEQLNQLVNIQTYLQDKYCLAYQYLFSKIHKEDLLNSVVLGIDTLNEPSEGFIETEDITKLPLISMTSTRNGPTPTVLESFLLGEGNSVEVAKYSLSTFGFVKEGTVRVDPKGENVWLKEGESILPNLFFPPWQPWQKEGQCIWHMHGVWDRATKKALLPNYFSIDPINGNKYNYLKDFWKPFVRKITSYIRTIQPDIIIFIEPPVNAVPPKFTKEEGDPIENIVYSPHWYDGKTLVTLKFDWWTFDYLGFIRGKYWFIGQALKLGRKDVRKCFEEMIEMIANEGKLAFPNAPLLIGECGIPFNMVNSNAFKNGDYKEQIDALDATLNATEQIGGMCTLWNYCIDNNHLEGDLWNREDLSIYSKDCKNQHEFDINQFNLYTIPLDKGGRALEAAIRPYALFTPGIPLSHQFTLAKDNKSGVPYYTYSFKGFENNTNDDLNDKMINKCELFLPVHHFPPATQLNVQINEGHWELNLTAMNSNTKGDNNNNNSLYDGYTVDQPLYQVLIWSFDFPLSSEVIYTIKITHADSPFPTLVNKSYFFC